MVYTTPKTWTNEPLVASDLNTHLRDNMEALKDPPSANYELDEASDYATTSTSFVDVDATNLALTIETNGGDVMVHFHGMFNAPNNQGLLLDLDVDGSRDGGDDGYIGHVNPNVTGIGAMDFAISFTRLITGLSAGSHTFKLQWKSTSGAVTLYAGSGASNADVHPQFWVREVS